MYQFLLLIYIIWYNPIAKLFNTDRSETKIKQLNQCFSNYVSRCTSIMSRLYTAIQKGLLSDTEIDNL